MKAVIVTIGVAALLFSSAALARDDEKVRWTPQIAEVRLMGYFINASIENQFEFVVREWLNASEFVGASRLHRLIAFCRASRP